MGEAPRGLEKWVSLPLQKKSRIMDRFSHPLNRLSLTVRLASE